MLPSVLEATFSLQLLYLETPAGGQPAGFVILLSMGLFTLFGDGIKRPAPGKTEAGMPYNRGSIHRRNRNRAESRSGRSRDHSSRTSDKANQMPRPAKLCFSSLRKENHTDSKLKRCIFPAEFEDNQPPMIFFILSPKIKHKG